MADHSTTIRNVKREAVFCERLCKSAGVPSLVEPVACPVLTRSCYCVDAQQLVAVDLDSRMRRSLWDLWCQCERGAVSPNSYEKVP